MCGGTRNKNQESLSKYNNSVCCFHHVTIHSDVWMRMRRNLRAPCLGTNLSGYFGTYSHVQCPTCPWIVNHKEQVRDAICTHSFYHRLHNGVENKLAEQNKGKAPLGEAVTGLWSYLTCLQRDWLWCSEHSSQTVTHSPENNCQTCSWAHWLPCRQHRHELLFILCSKCLSTVP